MRVRHTLVVFFPILLVRGKFILQIALVVAALGPLVLAQLRPRLTGSIETNPATGLLRADVCLSKLPQQKSFSLLLNRGLNIREIRDAGSGKPLSYEGFHDAIGVGDATRYTIEGDVSAGGFCISYVGMFPVYRVDAGERSELDWKGQIAFDGRTIRAAEQTRFYPIVIESATGAVLDSVSYQLDVSCTGCKAIYVNGSRPKDGPNANFASEVPRQLLLYAGDFPYASAGEVHFLGADIEPADAAAIRTGIKSISDVHSSYLGVPYRDEPVYLTFAAVARTQQLGTSTWAFTTWPTIALDGRIPFSQLLQDKEGKRVFIPSEYIAHEMAHYYFGTRYSPRGPLRGFLLESTAEFMAIKAERTLVGEPAYFGRISEYYKEAMAEREVTPLDSIRKVEQIDVTYAYRLGPLLLIALERYAGEDVVRKTLSGLITNSPVGEINYEDFRGRLLSSGATAQALMSFEANCLHKPVASGCLVQLGIK